MSAATGRAADVRAAVARRLHGRASTRRLGYTPHASMPAFARWFYFRFLATLLAPSPCPIWRAPAAALACVRVLFDAEGRALNDALLQALDLPTTRRARLRLHWTHWYQRETDILLTLQSRHLTPRWAATQVRYDGVLPQGGAILLGTHHAVQNLAMLVAGGLTDRLGLIAWRPPNDPATLRAMDLTLRCAWPHVRRIRASAVGDRAFHPDEAARKGLRLLREGGTLVMVGDVFSLGEATHPFLGRAVPIPPGAHWLGRHSGKPIHPIMLIPEGRRWRLWIGEPIAPTHEAVIAALEACIRRAPGNWERTVAMAWLRAPLWQTEAVR